MLFSLIALTLVYGALAVAEVVYLLRYIRGGVPAAMPELAASDDADGSDNTDGKDKDGDVLAFAY
jgi:cytochrome d ubiquinol oxidase subunit I